jgi:hypothetical protein
MALPAPCEPPAPVADRSRSSSRNGHPSSNPNRPVSGPCRRRWGRVTPAGIGGASATLSSFPEANPSLGAVQGALTHRQILGPYVSDSWSRKGSASRAQHARGIYRRVLAFPSLTSSLSSPRLASPPVAFPILKLPHLLLPRRLHQIRSKRNPNSSSSSRVW